MERYKKGAYRDPLNMVPMSLDDMIPEDAQVRARGFAKILSGPDSGVNKDR